MANVKSAASAGFVYTVEVVRNGVVIDREKVHNLIPTEGLNHILNTVFKEGTQVATWYAGLFSNNYTPIAADTMATFPGSAGEATAYDGANRVEVIFGTVASGAVDNEDSLAEFTASSSVTIYGGFISSNNVKSSTTGTLISAAKFSSPKTLDDGDVLRIHAGFEITSS
jgi:hypothetical protein